MTSTQFRTRTAGWLVSAALVASAMFGGAAPALAQVRTVDPDHAIDGDLAGTQNRAAPPPSTDSAPDTAPADPQMARSGDSDGGPPPAYDDGRPGDNGRRGDDGRPGRVTRSAAAAADGRGDTYKQDDLIGAAEGAFGKGAKGIAQVIQGILRKQGEPDGYIVGREGGGAFVVGLRYGSGTLYHKVEGQRPVYWTGPSVGFDAGANAGNAFVLVYNLYDSEDLYKRFVAGEGQAYLVGGFNVSYLRAGNVVLVPVRLGVGLRLGANIGYMKFSHKQDWVPF